MRPARPAAVPAALRRFIVYAIPIAALFGAALVTSPARATFTLPATVWHFRQRFRITDSRWSSSATSKRTRTLLVRLDLQDARVVGPLQHQERLVDVAGVEQRRDLVEILPVDGRVAEFLVEGEAKRLPVGGDTLQGAHPVGDAEDIHTDR